MCVLSVLYVSCVYLCGCGVCVCKLEKQLVLSWHHVGPRGWTQVVMLVLSVFTWAISPGPLKITASEVKNKNSANTHTCLKKRKQ